MPSRQNWKPMVRFRAVTARSISSSIAFLRLFRPINFPLYSCSLLGVRRAAIFSLLSGPHTGQSLRSQTPPVSGTDRPFTYSDHIKTRHLIMSDSKSFDDAKGDCSDENIGDRSDAQNQELVGDQISDPNQPVDAANSSPSGTPAGGNVPFPSMNNQLQMSVEPDQSGVIILQNANTFLAEENINLKFQCGRMKRDQKRLKRSLDGEKEKGIELAEKTENLSKILLMGPEAQLRERIAELEASNAQLRERNTELEASNAQLRERNTQLENGSNERVVDKENDHELGQARN